MNFSCFRKGFLAVLNLALALSVARSQDFSTPSQLASLYVKRIQHHPNVQFEWNIKTIKGEMSRTEYCFQNGKYKYTTYIKNAETGEEEISRMISYDGISYYSLSRGVLTVGSSLQEAGFGIIFQTKFLQNPLFYETNLLCARRGSHSKPFTMKQITDLEYLDFCFVRSILDTNISPSSVTLKLDTATPSRLARSVHLDPSNFHITGADLLSPSGQKVMIWELDDWKSLAQLDGEFRFPCKIVFRPIKDGPSESIVVDKGKIKLLEEEMPIEAFRVPSSAAKTIRDLDLGQDIKR